MIYDILFPAGNSLSLSSYSSGDSYADGFSSQENDSATESGADRPV